MLAMTFESAILDPIRWCSVMVEASPWVCVGSGVSWLGLHCMSMSDAACYWPWVRSYKAIHG